MALDLQRRFRSVIPGGAHTYAKGDDQYPEHMPPYIVQGRGCRITDVDGNDYIEYGMGLRSVVLGHAFGPVLDAIRATLDRGSNFCRPTPVELEVGEAILDLVPSGDMVKFGKHGSDVTSAAVRLARAYTGRDMIAVCADHPFYSTDDWFVGSTPMSAGIPQCVRDLTISFRYNDLDSVRSLFAAHPGRISCLILEPEKYDPPRDDFLHELRELCHRHGALLILDEMITGFRWHIGGAQAFYGVEPDLSTFGKALGNGFAVSALVGRAEVMRLGGFDHDRERVFLLSTTHGAEPVGLAAANATIETYRREPVIECLWTQGERLRRGVEAVAQDLGVSSYFTIHGRPCSLVFATLDAEGLPSQDFRTLFLQETLKRGVLAPSFVVSYAHDDAAIDRTIEAVGEALEVYRAALAEGVERYLEGRPVRPVFRAYA